jgi:elongation factor P--beta-lysine ligase
VSGVDLSADSVLTPAQAQQIMEQKVPPMAKSAVAGTGLVQVDTAVAVVGTSERAARWATTSPSPVCSCKLPQTQRRANTFCK